MTDIDKGATAPEEKTEPVVDKTAAPADNSGELATLQSRNSGLNAKVTELTTKLNAEREARTAAEQAAIDKAGSDEPLKKRIAELEADIEAGKKATVLAQKGLKYPESFAELGDDIATMTTEKLAALEARLTAAKDDNADNLPETSKPIGNSPARTTGAKSIEDMTSKELQDFIKSQDPSIMGFSR